MTGPGSTFLDVHLPNATTWFYLAVILGVALFFRFQRPWKLRNWDLLLLFLLVPGLLLLREGKDLKRQHQEVWRQQGRQICLLIDAGTDLAAQPLASGMILPWRLTLSTAPPELPHKVTGLPDRVILRAYLWLVIGSAIWLLRSLVDLAIRKRAPFASNLSFGGLAWLGLALFLILTTWAFLPNLASTPQAESQSVVLEKSSRLLSALFETESTQASATMWESALALCCHALILLALFWIGMQHFGDATTGMAAVVLYLLLPYTAFSLKDVEHVAPGALLVLAVAAYRWPLVSGTLLGMASGLCFFPVLLLPCWASFYWRRGLRWFLAPLVLMLLILGGMLWLDPDLQRGFAEALNRPEWQPWYYGAQPLAEGVWAGLSLHFAYRLPLFLGYLVLVVASIFWPAPKNLGHLIAWSVALSLGVQLWYADAGGIYVLWYLPLLVLLALKPTLTDRRPPELEPGGSWLARSARWLSARLPRRRANTDAAPIIKTLAHRKAG